MSIFSRLNDIINSNITALLDKAEDPQKIIRLVIQEMEDTLIEVRSDAARSIAERKKLRRHLQRLEREIAEWQRKAELALSRDREDLARAALSEKQRLQRQRDLLETDLKDLDEHLTKLNEDIAQLQHKLDEAKARHKAMKVKQDTLSGRLRTREKLHDERIADALGRFEGMEEKIDQMEGRVDAYDLGRSKTLDDEFAELETEDAVESELESLKARLRGQQSERPADKE